jgi:peroxiredoxin
LQSRIAEIRDTGAEVLGVSVDPQERNREVAEYYGIDYALLADTEGAWMDAFGVRHVAGGLDGDIARPATFLIDREGRVVWRDLTDNWRVRPRPEALIRELAAIP